MEQYSPQEAQQSYWGAAQGDMGMDAGLEALVSQVKDMQRNDPHAKEQWAAYTDSFGQGKRDPAKHNSEFLSGFITTLQTGTRIPVSDDSGQIADVVKILQKKSQNFKSMWTQFCKEFGGGTNDPHKHDSGFLVKFFDFISTQAGNSLPSGPMTMAMGGMGGGNTSATGPVIGGSIAGGRGAGGGGRGGDGGWVPTWSGKTGNGGWGGGSWGGEPPAKRPKIEPSAGVVIGSTTGPPNAQLMLPSWSTGTVGGGGGGGGNSSVPGTKDYLVSQVKAFQRIGDQQKELWGTYADMYLGGVRDPNRHDAATLEEFCINHGVPAPPAGGPQGSTPVGPMDPAKESLVMRVKTYQKASRDQSELWKQFCGPTCDPARHEAEKLQEFISMYSVP